jgi:hypothetical protein
MLDKVYTLEVCQVAPTLEAAGVVESACVVERVFRIQQPTIKHQSSITYYLSIYEDACLKAEVSRSGVEMSGIENTIQNAQEAKALGRKHMFKIPNSFWKACSHTGSKSNSQSRVPIFHSVACDDEHPNPVSDE